MLTRYKEPLKLKTWALAIAKRSTMRKARIALARRLAIIMHACCDTAPSSSRPSPDFSNRLGELKGHGSGCAARLRQWRTATSASPGWQGEGVAIGGVEYGGALLLLRQRAAALVSWAWARANSR
jgi:hypothetical protein